MCYPQHCAWQPLLCEQIQIAESFVCCVRLHLSDAEFWCCHEKTENSKKAFWPSQQKTTFASWRLTLNACVLLGQSQSPPFRRSHCQLSIHLIDVCLQTSKFRSGEAYCTHNLQLLQLCFEYKYLILSYFNILMHKCECVLKLLKDSGPNQGDGTRSCEDLVIFHTAFRQYNKDATGNAVDILVMQYLALYKFWWCDKSEYTHWVIRV